jgi:molybdopterin synthase sulfur carrier subunit
MATIILPRSLISLFPSAPRRCEVDASTVGEAIDRLEELVPGIRNRLVDAGPIVRTHINIFVDAQPSDLAAPIRPDSTIHIIPAVSGG